MSEGPRKAIIQYPSVLSLPLTSDALGLNDPGFLPDLESRYDMLRVPNRDQAASSADDSRVLTSVVHVVGDAMSLSPIGSATKSCKQVSHLKTAQQLSVPFESYLEHALASATDCLSIAGNKSVLEKALPEESKQTGRINYDVLQTSRTGSGQAPLRNQNCLLRSQG